MPFHAWTPQAYSTADLGTAAALAAASKIAALAALLVVAQALVGAAVDAAPVTVVVGVLAVASMLLGNVMALRQDDATRLLAWSTVAQAGLGRAAASPPSARPGCGRARPTCSSTRWPRGRVRRGRPRGRRDRSPASAVSCAATGHRRRARPWRCSSSPACRPGIVGLVAKVVALRPAVEAGLWPLVLVAVVAVVLGIAVYLRWFALLVAEPGTDAVPARGRGARVVLWAGTVLLVVLSALPALLLDLLA